MPRSPAAFRPYCWKHRAVTPCMKHYPLITLVARKYSRGMIPTETWSIPSCFQSTQSGSKVIFCVYGSEKVRTVVRHFSGRTSAWTPILESYPCDVSVRDRVLSR